MHNMILCTILVVEKYIMHITDSLKFQKNGTFLIYKNVIHHTQFWYHEDALSSCMKSCVTHEIFYNFEIWLLHHIFNRKTAAFLHTKMWILFQCSINVQCPLTVTVHAVSLYTAHCHQIIVHDSVHNATAWCIVSSYSDVYVYIQCTLSS